MKKKILLLSCASLLTVPVIDVVNGEATSEQPDNTIQDNSGGTEENNRPNPPEADEENGDNEDSGSNSNNNDNNTSKPPSSSPPSTGTGTGQKPSTGSGTGQKPSAGTTTPSKPTVDTSKEEEKLEELQNNLDKIEENKSQIEQEISSIQQFITAAEKELMIIRNKIADTETKITLTEENIKANEEKLVKLEKKIEKKTEELEKQKVRLGHTLSFLYEYRNFGFLQFFFQSENLSDLLTMADFITLIMDENNTIYERIVAQEEELQKEKKELNNTMKKLEEEKATLEKLKLQQLQEKAIQDKLLEEQLEKELEAFERLGAEEQAETELNAEIRKILLSISNSMGNVNANGKMASPMKAGTYTITSTFGYRTHPVFGTQKMHNGIDMAGSCGTPIYSAADGVVTIVGPATGYGNWIVIYHEKLGLFSIYGHMYSDGLYVKQGQTVKQGQLIGAVGSAGYSTGCHLHLSVATSYNGSTFTYIDPLSVIE